MENQLKDLQERLEINKKRQLEIERILEFLPKGHINILKRNGKGYYYLTYREGKKVNNEYLGVVGKADLNKTITRLKQRENIKLELSELKNEEKTLNKLIKRAKWD